MINSYNLPILSSGYSINLIVGAEWNEPKLGGEERSQKPWSGKEAESGDYRNRLDHGVAFSPLMLRSHALFTIITFRACFTKVKLTWPSTNRASN